MRRLSLIAVLLAMIAIDTHAQGPAHDWRTIETKHFRVHYPREFEAWAMRGAERLEPIHDAVSKEVGSTPKQVIDVLVMNPIAEPNGSAWTFLDTPRIIFWTEPPGPDEQLGAYGNWIDLLAVHEVAHVVHMLRPSRNPFERFIETSVLPLNPITLHAPRWVLEGYATLVEGRLTGAGRPSSTIRALILRQLAETGRVPTDAQLNSDPRFLGMSMAYLMGSAFLEWLEQRNGPESLRNVWARMTARQRRSFDAAFIGVFGERPDRLYGQFLAEVTASAIAVRRARALQQGVLFQETPRASGNPAVSPDGSQLAVVIRAKDKPEKLVVWSTAAADEEEKKFRERLEKVLGRDPEDVAPLRTKPLPREPKHELVMPDGGDIQNPRWSRDGKSIVFAHRAPDAEGVLHFDLYRWDFANVTRITHLADVRDADLIDDDTMIAVRSRDGVTELVTVKRSGAAGS
ncbi:MAG: TolB family protein, partial [Thermoanaerobaculia bacterium]